MSAAPAPIAIAGAGPVAQALGFLLGRHGYTVVALASRSRAHADLAARFIGAAVESVEYEDLGRRAIPTLIAVSDSALPRVALRMASTASASSLVVHTCGVAGPDVLEPLRERGWSCGVLHPLQTVPTREQGVDHLMGTTFGVGGDKRAVEWAASIAESLNGRPLAIRPDRFALYHAGAALAGNGTFALVEAALALLGEAGLPRDEAAAAIGPLCRASLTNALGPVAAPHLTGPVARGDVSTVRAHLAALSPMSRDLGVLYSAVSTVLLSIAQQRGLPQPLAAEMQSLLVRNVHGERDGTDQGTSS